MHLKHTLGAAGTALLLGAFLAACNTDKTTGPSSDNATLAADTTFPDVDWYSHAMTFQGQNNLRVAYACPDSGTVSAVWGTDVYTDDSSVCTAAVHSGLITLAAGGRVVIEIRPGLAVYDSSTRHGITTFSYGVWSGSYAFP